MMFFIFVLSFEDFCTLIVEVYFLILLFYVFFIRENPTFRKVHFVGPDERVKPRLSHILIRGARPDSNSRPAVQISSFLLSRYVH
jgi:hypothetical protein